MTTPPSANRPKPTPLKRTAAQIARTVQAELGAKAVEETEKAQTAAQADAARLAQVANLLIAGHSLTSIGAAIGASAEEVDQMLQRDMSRYVRNQPALRVFVRNYLSSKYTAMLDAVWDEATDKMHREKLEHQDRALRILKEMGKLHGAEAPTQSEVKVDAAPETVDALVARIAAAQGMGYDTSIFDVVPGTVVHQAAASTAALVERTEDDVEQPQIDDQEFGEQDE